MAAGISVWLLLAAIAGLQSFSHSTRYGSFSETLHVASHLREKDEHPQPKFIDASLYSSRFEVKDDVRRTKRSTVSAASNLAIFPLNDSHNQLLVHWAGKDSDVIICLAYDREQTAKSTSKVFISYDYGATYIEKQKDKMRISPVVESSINMFYISPVLNSHFIFTDIIHNYIFTTRDYGKTFEKVHTTFTPDHVAMHLTNVEVIVAMDNSDPLRKLYLSEDFGATWTAIESHVKSFFWGKDGLDPPNTLYIERREPGHTSTVIRSSNYFKNEESEIVVIADVEDFEVQDKYLFATRLSHLIGSHNANGTLQLWVSYNRQPFQNALFPSHLDRKDFYIADASEDQVFVCVMHDAATSNLYISDIKGVTFSLSLERILYIKSTTRGRRLETEKEIVDFHKVQGLRGVYIATQLKEDSQNSTLKNLVSVITFDKGGDWRNLVPPKVDKNGKLLDCKQNLGCSLHVSQRYNQLFSRTKTSAVLSRKSAVGIVLASGVLGGSMNGHPSLFISSDAGLTWHHVMYGSYLYNFGDFGGVLVAVEHYTQKENSNRIWFSLDDGETWDSLKLFNDNSTIQIYALMTEPGEKTTVFTLFGSYPFHHNWVLIKVDLRNYFQYDCQPDDYKLWSPHGPSKSCILGRRDVYQRRISRIRCYNGKNYERPITTENCPCNREDFECDFGFKEDRFIGHCIRDGDSDADPYAIPVPCKEGSFYNRTKGYRKISGDSCVGGEDFRYNSELRSCPLAEESEFLIVADHQKVSRVALNTDGKNWETLPLPPVKNVVAIDYDYHNNCLYWADFDEDTIMRFRLDGKSKPELLLHSSNLTIEGLAFDWISLSLYFVDGLEATVKILHTNSTVSGHIHRTILNHTYLDKPRGIAIHPLRGYLFITDWSDKRPTIARAYLDGSQFVRLFDSSIVAWPNGVTIDYQDERIFFVDAKKDYIASADFDGRNIKYVIEGSSVVPHAFTVAVYKDWIYFDDWDKRGIFMANKMDGSGLTMLTSTEDRPMDLKVFSHGMQQGTNICSNSSSNPCSHFCIALPHDKRICLCPNDVAIEKLPDGNEKCLCPGNHFLLPNGTCPSVSSTCSPDQFQCKNELCIPKLWQCDAADDCGDGSDETYCTPNSCAANQFKCGNGFCIPSSWRCDFDKDCMDGTDENNCDYPSCKTGQFKCGNGRCIITNYRCDLDDDCKDGTDEENCTTIPSSCSYNEYSCKISKQCIPNTWKCDGERDCKEGNDDEEGCNVTTCEKWQYSCANGHCIFGSWRCDGENDCGDHSDEENCNTTTVPSTTTSTSEFTSCSPWKFKCDNNNCIPFWWRCDNVDDCNDNSDEYFCEDKKLATTTSSPSTTEHAVRCGSDHFRCDSGRCIWNSWICDGTNDCNNGEDEKDCQAGVVCSANYFRCVHSSGCVPPSDLCDGKKDCGDGSDEWGCSTVSSSTAVVQPCLSSTHFLCKTGECIHLINKCNNVVDCYDGSDEENCSKDVGKFYTVKNLMVDKKSVTATSFIVIWEPAMSTGNSSFQYLPVIQDYSNMEWRNGSLVNSKSSERKPWFNYTFVHLIPGRNYRVKVDVFYKQQYYPSPVSFYINITTDNKAPPPPRNVTAQQQGHTILLAWSPPKNFTGIISGYVVRYSPPLDVARIDMPAITRKLLQDSFEPGVNYSFWVTAKSRNLESNNSEVVYLVFNKDLTIDPVSGLNVSDINNNSMRISWNPATTKVDGYCLSYRLEYPNEYLPWQQLNTSSNVVTVTSLSPGANYTIKVFAYRGGFAGPVESVVSCTAGKPLPEITMINSTVQGATVSVWWDASNDKRTDKWLYGVYTSKLSYNNMTLIANTSSTNFTVTSLNSCEIYQLEVRIIGPFGIGPSTPYFVFTKFDVLAPPKNFVAAPLPNKQDAIKISWNASCPLLDINCGYKVFIHDVVTNKTEITSVKSTNKTYISINKMIHFGAKYILKVRTDHNGSRFTENISYVAPEIPIPQQVRVVLEKNGSLFVDWEKPVMPPELSNHSFNYSVWISEDKSTSKALHYTATEPPIVIPPVAEGKIYHVAVSLTDNDGYQSQLSDWNDFGNPTEKRKIIVSISNLVSIVVPVVVIITALIAAVVYFSVRHRRLQRSFLSFANSHYDTHSVSATFSNSEALDEEDSPMIRGFSDDEPLIIA